MSNEKPRVRLFLSRALVIDWLQWSDFSEQMDGPDYPQMTLSLIAEYKAEVERLEKEVLKCCSSNCICRTGS